MKFYALRNYSAPVQQRFNSQRDEILPHCLERYERWKTVSIPNGMKFYIFLSPSPWEQRQRFNSQRDEILLYLAFLWLCCVCFNSQRDEILRVVCGIKVPVLTVSIPNGMKFYTLKIYIKQLFRRFQFPTGWNSTFCVHISQRSPSRFNSQRDEILLFLLGVSLIMLRVFQFPTGWNSTQTSDIPSSHTRSFNSQRDEILQSNFDNLAQRWKSFNSQRDEILPIDALAEELRNEVSIPNGMKFYDTQSNQPIETASGFQFPTGWNSTEFRASLQSLKLRGFNSQRDEILLAMMSMYCRYGEFQFPTGWNSTPALRIHLHSSTCFNSQRDEILL